jgi:hypothetical protein
VAQRIGRPIAATLTAVNALWIMLLVVSVQTLPLSGAKAQDRAKALDGHKLQSRAATARTILRTDWRHALGTIVIVPVALVALSWTVGRSPVPSLIEFAAWCIIVAALRTRILRGSGVIIGSAKERGVTLPPRRTSAKARRFGMRLVALGIALGASAALVASLAGTTSSTAQAAVVSLGFASVVTFFAALIASVAYYGDERTEPVPLPD